MVDDAVPWARSFPLKKSMEMALSVCEDM